MIGLLSRSVVGLMLGMLLMVGSYHVGVSLVHAQPAPAIDAGSATGSAIASPADQLPDLASNPTKAFDAEKAAYKLGWPLGLLAAIIMLGRGIGQAGRKLAWLAWLNKGAAAVITAGAVTVAIAAFNALALGGTWYAAALASAAAGFALLKPHVEPQPASPSS